MKHIAHISLPLFLLGALMLPSFANADTPCGAYTCTGNQVCSYDLDNNPAGCTTPNPSPSPNPNPNPSPTPNPTPTPSPNPSPAPSGTGGLYNPLGTTDLSSLVQKILAFIVQIGAIVIVFMLVYVGFLFVTARGEPGKLTTAKNALLWTIVGALVLLGAQAISMGIQATVSALSTGG